MKNLYKTLLLVAFILILVGCNSNSGMMNQSSGKTFSKDISNLQEAKEPEIVELKDGDTYDLTAEIIKKEIGDKEETWKSAFKENPNKRMRNFNINIHLPHIFGRLDQQSVIALQKIRERII